MMHAIYVSVGLEIVSTKYIVCFILFFVRSHVRLPLRRLEGGEEKKQDLVHSRSVDACSIAYVVNGAWAWCWV